MESLLRRRPVVDAALTKQIVATQCLIGLDIESLGREREI
jgi:hypothetical protein